MKQDKWLKKYPMINYKKADCKKIRNSVGKKLSEQKDEVIYMKQRRLKPLAVAAAVLAVSAASLFTVNAATDGAVVDTVKEWFQNVTVYINGEEVEVPAKVKQGTYSDGKTFTEYEIEVDEEIEVGDENEDKNEIMFEIQEDENSEMIITEK